jgi:hypothetical protein
VRASATDDTNLEPVSYIEMLLHLLSSASKP